MKAKYALLLLIFCSFLIGCGRRDQYPSLNIDSKTTTHIVQFEKDVIVTDSDDLEKIRNILDNLAPPKGEIGKGIKQDYYGTTPFEIVLEQSDGKGNNLKEIYTLYESEGVYQISESIYTRKYIYDDPDKMLDKLVEKYLK